MQIAPKYDNSQVDQSSPPKSEKINNSAALDINI